MHQTRQPNDHLANLSRVVTFTDMNHYPDDDDGAVLRAIAADGIDMTQPLLIEFTVTALDRESAFAIKVAIASNLGFETSMAFDEGEFEEDGHFDAEEIQTQPELGPHWLICANVTMIPDYHEIVRIQAELDKLSRPHGGQSCGWGATIEKYGEESK